MYGNNEITVEIDDTHPEITTLTVVRSNPDLLSSEEAMNSPLALVPRRPQRATNFFTHASLLPVFLILQYLSHPLPATPWLVTAHKFGAYAFKYPPLQPGPSDGR